MLCPECDRDRLDELTDDDGDHGDVEDEPPRRLDLNAQLAELGREAAREAWHEHGGELASVPHHPDYRAWTALAYALCLLDNDQRLTDTERRVFEHAYRNELHALAANNELRSIGGAP